MLNNLEVIRACLIAEGIHRESTRLDGTYQYRVADAIDASIHPQAADWLAPQYV